MPGASFRQERIELNRLFRALILSLVFHLLIVGTYQAGKKYQWWDHMRLPSWFQPPLLTELLKKKSPAQALKPAPTETPLVFLDVSPDQAVAEPPEKAKFYSAKNSVAANPDADQETDTPKITGTQTEVPKTQDVPREKQITTLQPAPPKAQPAPVAQEEQKPKSAEAPGDITVAKSEQTPQKDPGKSTTSRPRTVVEALMRKNLTQPPGQKMKQEGGVKARREIASLDTKSTPFGAYDAALIEAIRGRWYSLLDERSYASDSRGKVVLRFQLHYDGRITDMDISENSSTEMLGLICQKAVMDPAPFEKWPAEMRRLLGEVRNIQFTFYYQ